MEFIKIYIDNIGGIYRIFTFEDEIIDKFSWKEIVDDIDYIFIIRSGGGCPLSKGCVVIDSIFG